MNKRNLPFLLSIIFLALLLFAGRGNSQIAASGAGAAMPKVIDVHMHYTGDPEFRRKLLERMQAVDGMAFLSVVPSDMNSAVPFIHQHPDRLVGMANIDMDSAHALEQIDAAQAAGFVGLGELEYVAHDFDDPIYFPIYERAEKDRMILLFHTGIVNRTQPDVSTNVSAYRMRAMTLDLIARKYPKLIIIGAHLGNPDYAWAAEIARWNPNLYFDLSGSSLTKKQNDFTFFNSIFWWSGVVSPHTPKSARNAFEKLVFGSDVFEGELEEFDRELKLYHQMLDACGVPKEAQQNIFSGTAWSILHRER